VLALCFAAFVAFGVVLVLPGANQKELADALGLDLSRTGLLASTLALGLGVGVIGAGPLFDRYPRRPLFAGSTALAALALISVDESTGFTALVTHIAVLGVGIGAYDTTINALVAERFQARASRPMAAVHSGATLGGVLGPAFVALASAGRHWSASFQAIGALHLAITLWALLTRFPQPPPHRPAEAAPAEPILSASLLPFAGVAFAYVGVESALTVFAVPYATGALALDEGRGRAAISAFWMGLLAGRLAMMLLREPDARVLVGTGLLASAALALGTISGAVQVEVFFAAVGFSIGCVYPLMISLAGQRFPHARGTVAGLVAGAGAVGGFAIPWLTGAIGDRLGIVGAVASLIVWTLAIAAAAAAAVRPGPARSR